jgi:2-isopropylmalate synthase
MFLYDTTLRDGAQGQAVTFSLQDKEQIIRRLDEVGMHFIEAGNPASNPRDAELYERMRGFPLKNARLVAFGSTRRVGVPVKEDAGLRLMADLACDCVSIFGKSWDFHVTNVLRATLQENLCMIRDSVSFLREAGKTVFFDAEHFFDGYRENPDYALATLRAAADAGAEFLVLCDTNGGTLPEDIRTVTAAVSALYPGRVGIHCHNDSGVAVAASLSAVRAGAAMVQGTVNGLGERCGNADLCAVIPNLVLKMGVDCFPRLGALTSLSRLVSSVCNLVPEARAPYVGGAAFTHKGGMHIDGVLKDPRSFEHIRPEQVGNSRSFVISDLAGRNGLMSRLNEVDPQLDRDSPVVARIWDRLKQMEFEGYQFEDAEDSFLLMVRKEMGLYRAFYEVLDFQVLCQRPEDVTSTVATIKVRVGSKVEITAAEGDGPVNALDCALRRVLTLFYPQLQRMRLVDFKVRVVDSDGGTASRVRVHIRSSDGRRTFGTVGVSTSILQAAWMALVDSIDAMLLSDPEASPDPKKGGVSA